MTFGPDADWQSVVVVLEPGEKVEPSSGVFFPMGLDEHGRPRTSWPEPGEEREAALAYDPSDPKSAGYHDRMAGIWDDREKV